MLWFKKNFIVLDLIRNSASLNPSFFTLLFGNLKLIMFLAKVIYK